MKILHLLDERWDSGLTHYALQIANLLHKNGQDVTVGVLPGKKPEQQAKACGLKTASVNSVVSLIRLVRAEKWDVIDAHTGRMHSWALFLTPSSVPIIRTRGDARPVHANPVSRFIYGKTAAVIAASAHIGGYYEEDFQMDEKKLSVIYPSVKPDEHITPLPSARIGILGRLDPVKGHAYFLEAASHVLTEFPQAKFVIAGQEANVSFDLLKNQIQTLGIERAVEYVGFQPSAVEFMRGCSIGVVASIGSEEISRACLEWMATGRPVVGTLVGCLSELIEPSETGLLVPPGEGVAMGEALLKLLRDPPRAAQWGQNANRLVEQKFSPRVQLEKTLELYNRVRG